MQDPSKRWSCEQLLKHAFFKNFSVKLPEDEEVHVRIYCTPRGFPQNQVMGAPPIASLLFSYHNIRKAVFFKDRVDGPTLCNTFKKKTESNCFGAERKEEGEMDK